MIGRSSSPAVAPGLAVEMEISSEKTGSALASGSIVVERTEVTTQLSPPAADAGISGDCSLGETLAREAGFKKDSGGSMVSAESAAENSQLSSPVVAAGTKGPAEGLIHEDGNLQGE